jgi:hypothetical protein
LFGRQVAAKPSDVFIIWRLCSFPSQSERSCTAPVLITGLWGAAQSEVCRGSSEPKGWLWKHEFGTYVKFLPAGADLFA